MKRKILYSLIVMLLALPALVKAQAPASPVIYKEWTPFGEQGNEIEVEYRVIKCVDVNQIHLFLFNENNLDKNLQFSIEITNVDNNEKYTKEISFQATKFKMYKPLCDSDASLDALKINIPASFNPANLTLKITFKP